MMHQVSWREYERAMFNLLYYQYRGPAFLVEPDLRTLRGVLSSCRRQVDVVVYRAGQARPFLAVETKRYNRKLNIKDVEAFLSMLEDLGCERGLLVAPIGFSAAARRRAGGSRVVLHKLPEAEAVRLNWREVARGALPWDEGFHPSMGDALYWMLSNPNMDECMGALQAMPYEEWDAVFREAMGARPLWTAAVLRAVAEFHHDEDWRFAAISLLDEYGWLDDALARRVMDASSDPEIRDLLSELIGHLAAPASDR